MEEECREWAVEGDPVEHLDDAEVGVLRVAFVVCEEDAESGANTFRREFHYELTEIEFLLHGVGDKLENQNKQWYHCKECSVATLSFMQFSLL